jgi:hypothetical protein
LYVCRIYQIDGMILAISFFPRMEGKKNEIYPLAIVGRASNVGGRVGSGSGSRYRTGARICGG